MQNHASQSSKIASFHLCGWSQEYYIFTSEPNTCTAGDERPFSVLFRHSHLKPVISARKCANTTEKMSSCYRSTAREKTETLKLKVMSNCSKIVSPLTVCIFNMHMSVCLCVCMCVHYGERCCNPSGKMLTLAHRHDASLTINVNPP